MKYLVYLLLLLLPLTACKKSKQNVRNEIKTPLPVNEIVIDSTGVPLDPSIAYFPIELDTLNVRNCSKVLFAMYEPIIYNSKADKESFRVIMFRTIKNPVMVKLEKENDTITLTVKVTSGVGGTEPGRIKVNNSKILSKKEWDEFQILIKNCDFWNLPAIGDDRKIAGEHFILEGYKKDDYNVTHEWDPSADDNFKIACMYLLKLGDVDK